jgi:glycosyltransferase involved in cell wall biosynthesis
MARLLIQALAQAGHEVETASRFRSWQGVEDAERQARLARLGAGLANRLLRRYRASPATRPQAWLTYHLYYKAPDWIGPRVAGALGIPYLVAEASVAPKRAGGPWDLGHGATLAALEAAAAVIAFNPADLSCLPPASRAHRLAPFLDLGPTRAAAGRRDRVRAELAGRHGLDDEAPWIATAAMMRPGDKLASYRLLAEALAGLAHLSWQLLVAGDGPARSEVETAFARLPDGADARVRFLGELGQSRLTEILSAADLFAWPAVGEAYGMALLEAQAAGLAAVAGSYGGVPAIVDNRKTGLLAPVGDPGAFAAALEVLLRDPGRRRRMGAAARAKAEAEHGLEAAATHLDAILREAGGAS